MIKIGVIGCGYWGPNLVRNFNELDEAKVEYVCDLRPERREFIKKRYPAVKVTADYRDVLQDRAVDAVAIVTPLSTHFTLAQAALTSNKHVLLEKPMAANISQAKKLIALSRKRKKVLMAGHTFLYTGAIRKIREIIDRGELGKIHYFDSVRINLGMFQRDTNVIWDLAAHDFSIMDYLLQKEPLSVCAAGACHADDNVESIAYITVRFADNVIAHFYVNWLSPVKIRQILIGGSEKMIFFDDMQSSEKVKVYDKGVSVKKVDEKSSYKTRIEYRSGDMYAPKLDITEALRNECQHFIECIKQGKKPLSSAEQGLRVVRLLEAAEKSLKNRSKTIQI